MSSTASLTFHVLAQEKLVFPSQKCNPKWPYFHLSQAGIQGPNDSQINAAALMACRQIWERYASPLLNESEDHHARCLFILGLMRLGKALPTISTYPQWQVRFLKEQSSLTLALRLQSEKPLQIDWICPPMYLGQDPILLGKQLVSRALQSCYPQLADLLLELPSDMRPANPAQLLEILEEISNAQV